MSAPRLSPNSMRLRYVPEDDPYPLIRSALAPDFATLPAEDVERLLENNGLRATDMEGFFDDVGHAFSSAAKAIAPVAGKALPGVISGAATGCALGPWGCLGGALIGGLGSALAGGGGAAPSAPKAGTSPVSAIAGAIPAIAGAAGGGGGIASGLASALPAIAGLVGGGGTGAAGAGGGAGPVGAKTNPAGVLLGLVQRPEVIQALMSMALGSAGSKDVSVGGNSVPVSAFANLFSALGSKAFAQAEAVAEPSEDLPAYLYSNGVLAADPAVPSQRAARLLEMLGEQAVITPRIYRRALSEADEYYDALDIAELDLLEMEGNDFEFDD